MFVLWIIFLHLSLIPATPSEEARFPRSGLKQSAGQSHGKSFEIERERRLVKQRFAKNFRQIQVTGQTLLRDHIMRTLTPKQLAKGARTINKNARSLRGMMALGNTGEEKKIDTDIDEAGEFDRSIKRLAQLIWDFAHNPIHQNSKVFDTDQATRASSDLLTIIKLSRVIETRALSYVAISANNQ